MVRLLTVIDVDRTIFRTDALMRDLLAVLADLSSTVSVSALQSAAHNTEQFDPFSMLEGLTHAEVAKALRRLHPTDPNPYLYQDVPGFITFVQRHRNIHPVLLTTGNTETQLFKLSLCPALAELPQAVTQENKGRVLERQFQANGTIVYDDEEFHRLALADDKSGTFDPLEDRPGTFNGYHVIRPDSRYPRPSRHPNVTVIDGLVQGARLLTELAA